MLQGSLDNFALDEVLGLLASTTKTGTLEVKGDRGTGALALRQGQLVGATATNMANGAGTEDIVFELMRFVDGSFLFTPGEVDGSEPARQVLEVLASAENRLSDWRTIEIVVPSLNHTVSPVPALQADEITINRREWSTLIVIGSGCPVSAVCTELELGEVEGSRQIKNLADRGLVSVGPPLNKGAAAHGPRPPAAAGAALDPLPRPVADPFARRAEQSSIRRVESLSPPAPAGPAPDAGPGAGRELAGAGAASRPPMPAPPTAAELRRADFPAPSGRSMASVLEADPEPAAAVAPTPAVTPPVEPSKPGGLLMRYLKGED